jgi:hypothetical protein
MNLLNLFALALTLIAIVYGISVIIHPPAPSPSPSNIRGTFDSATKSWWVTWTAPSNQGNNNNVQNLTYDFQVTLNGTQVQSGSTQDTKFQLSPNGADPTPFTTYTVTLVSSNVISKSQPVSATITTSGTEQIKNVQFVQPIVMNQATEITGTLDGLTSPDTTISANLSIIGTDNVNYGGYPGTCTLAGQKFSCSFATQQVPPNGQSAGAKWTAEAYLQNKYGTSLVTFTNPYVIPTIPPDPPSNIALVYN